MSPKSIVLAAGAALSLVAGAAAQYFYPYAERSPVDIVFTIVGVLLIFAWYRLDVRQTGYRRSPLLNVAVVAIAILGLPYYFFRSRGAKRGLVATGLFLLTIVSSSVLAALGQAAVLYGLQGH
ncbi:hypothetical protein MUU75_12625 [Pseudoxanthomonas mexicana]|uniref:hypothetical protein n=1 Tax=Pseudoxanthomonas mexicana TaxID=128785 RepID=UPI001FD6A015|nr:hypothetical protein [Pseudoxanthomonas mexicana]UOV04000.1 hypothetical protein MUU75_12625 [Pseudoxanthomonas mexicana]